VPDRRRVLKLGVGKGGPLLCYKEIIEVVREFVMPVVDGILKGNPEKKV
jgi:hypothetical protein